jgi:hypothetical protein
VGQTEHRPSGLWVLAFVLILAFAPIAFFKILGSACLSARVFQVYGLVCCLVLLPLVLWRFRWAKVGVCLVFLLALFLLWRIQWSTQEPFLRDLGRIRSGMTVAQVEAIMKPYIKGTGWPAPDSVKAGKQGSLTALCHDFTTKTTASPSGELVMEDCLVYRHSNDAAFNSDWGVVQIRNGRVVRVRFLPD